jgi:hypothetical protein
VDGQANHLFLVENGAMTAATARVWHKRSERPKVVLLIYLGQL